MYKDQEIKIEDSNIANLGTDLEKQVKLAAAQTERAWDGAGNKVGLDIWRIEQFQVVRWPKDQYGSFYSGDSYIVLNTYKKTGSDELHWNAHMWVGLNSTQDEMGTAAYKIVELDDLFHRKIVLFREVQGHESDLFLSYFNVIHIMEGGVETGFKKVPVEEYKPRLLHIKGKKHFRVTQVNLSSDSLNSNDVFILDAGLILYNWIGSKANPFEKFKASSVCQSIKEDRKSLPKIVKLEEEENDNDFWNLLGGKGPIKSETSIKDEDIKNDKVMFRVTDSSGKLTAQEIECKRQNLDTNDVFIVDFNYQIYVWIGDHSSPDEKKNSLPMAMRYMENYSRPKHVSICVMREGYELESFRESFQ
jgi:gelsolin